MAPCIFLCEIHKVPTGICIGSLYLIYTFQAPLCWVLGKEELYIDKEREVRGLGLFSNHLKNLGMPHTEQSQLPASRELSVPLLKEGWHPVCCCLQSLAFQPQNGRWQIVAGSKFPISHKQVHTFAGGRCLLASALAHTRGGLSFVNHVAFSGMSEVGPFLQGVLRSVKKNRRCKEA